MTITREFPDRIHAWFGIGDNGSWDVEPYQDGCPYIRKDRVITNTSIMVRRHETYARSRFFQFTTSHYFSGELHMTKTDLVKKEG